LVDNIRTEIKFTQPAQIPLQPQSSKPDRPAPSTAGQSKGERISPKPALGVGNSAPKRALNPHPPLNGEPPEPEGPPDWEAYTPVSAGLAAQDATPDQVVEIPEDDSALQADPPGGTSEDLSGQPGNVPLPAVVLTPKLPILTLPGNLPEDHAPQMVTIILRPSGDSDRDIRRISRLHGTFISYPGKDRFAFQIFEEGRGHLIEFPNDNTHLCPELAVLLTDTVGEENVRVEPILYQ
jgi:hypothetical protein